MTDSSAAASQRQPKPANRASRPLFVALMTGLALCPLWYGGFAPLPSVIIVAGFALLTLVALVAFLSESTQFAIPSRIIAFPALCLMAVVGWALFQALGSAPDGLAAPIWRLAADALQIEMGGRVSVAPLRTLAATALLAGYALVFWLALQLGRQAQLASRAIEIIFGIAVAYAVWGLLDHSLGLNLVLFEPKDPYALDRLGGFVSGTFRNRDHFAAFCAIGFLCGLVAMQRRIRHALDLAAMDNIKPRDMARLIVSLLGLICLVLAIWLSRGRSVIALTLLCTLTLAAHLALRLWSAGRRGAGLTLVATALMLGVGILVWTLESGLSSERIATLGKSFEDRMAIYRLVTAAISDNLWTGVGHGAFVDAFPVYRTAEAGYGGFWNAAHNIYLEAMLGLGLPAFVLLACAVGWCVWRVFLGAFRRRRNTTAPLAAAAASVFVLLHGLVDFSLQTPAVACIWSALLGFGVAQSWSSREILDWSNSDEW